MSKKLNNYVGHFLLSIFLDSVRPCLSFLTWKINTKYNCFF